jgi:hypothetical protein
VATRPIHWAIGGFAALIVGSIFSAWGWFIATETLPDVTQVVRGGFTLVGLVCFAIYVFQVERLVAVERGSESAAASEPEAALEADAE